MRNSKSIVSFICHSLFSIALFCQQRPLVNLSLDSASFTSVIGGKALCQPENTSYGFVVLTDGKMLCACSENGTKLWQRGIPGKPEPFFSVIQKDFLVTVSDKRNLSLINPSGLPLWTVKVPFAVVQSPYAGRDSRIFVVGEKNVACYGLNGIQKWKVETRQLGKLPLSFLNDGTFIVFHEEADDGHTVGVRISPFGEVLETITFAGLVKDVVSVNEGILLVFSGGGTGLCSVAEGKTITKWAISHNDPVFSKANINQGGRFVSVSQNKTALLYPSANQTKVFIISNRNGIVLSQFVIDDLSFFQISALSPVYSSECFFVSDKKNAFVYDSEGKRLWGAKLPTDKVAKTDFISYTNDNHLVLCGANWLLTGFRTIQMPTSKKREGTRKADYRNSYPIDSSYFDSFSFQQTIPQKFVDVNRIRKLKAGNYAQHEIQWLGDLYSVVEAYSLSLSTVFSGARSEKKSVFQTDISSLQQIVLQVPFYGIEDSSRMLSRLITLESNESMLITLFRSAARFGFDSDGKLLEAIARKLQLIPASNSNVLIEMCDCVFEICRFMGRPALYSYGMDIMKKLLYPQYDSQVRDKARNTLSKISSLKI